MAYGSNYYEADREVVRTTSPYIDSCAPGYVDPVYPRRHHNGMSTVVTEVVAEQQAIPNGGYGYGHHHHHGRPVTEIVEREERIVENAPYGSYRTPMY